MRKETIKRLEKLKSEIESERKSLHNKIFVENHPILIQGEYEKNRKELRRYQEFHAKYGKNGFDNSRAINKLVKLDAIISDLASLLYFENNKNN